MEERNGNSLGETMQFDPVQHRIFETVTGSHLYGTSTPESDIDYRGVCVPPLEVLLDPFNGFEQKDSGFEEKDRTIYSLDKFLKLASDANPNVIELLFAPKASWTYSTWRWEVIVANIPMFVSKKARFTFSGMAMGHIKRIKRHYQWQGSPPVKPERKDYDLPEMPRIANVWLETIKPTMNMEIIDPALRDEFLREMGYKAARENYNHYLQWDKERNPARKSLEMKYGYDTKDAMHLIRIMREGEELLRTGRITFPLTYAHTLLEIRNGSMTYDQVMIMAEQMDAYFNAWEAASKLPFGPDRKGLTQLYLDILAI
jgi:uncharacterized protein